MRNIAPLCGEDCFVKTENKKTALMQAEKDETKSAVLVGINYYESQRYATLRGCIHDAYVVMRFLQTRCGFPEDRIKMIADNVTGKDKEKRYPSRKNILQSLRDLMKDTTSRVKFFYYSGHGAQVKDTSGDEFDGLDEAICPATGGKIIDDDIRECIDAAPPGSEVFVLLDCCHSGTGADLPWIIRRKHPWTQKKWKLVRAGRHADFPPEVSVVSLSGCSDNALSYDRFIDRHFRGAMTWAFMRAFADGNREFGSWEAMYTWIRKQMKHSTYPQKPKMCFGHLKGHKAPIYSWLLVQ